MGFARSAATSDLMNRRGMLLSGAVYKKAAATQRISDRSPAE